MKKLSVLFALAAFTSLSPATTQARTLPPPSLSAADKAHVLGDTFTVVRTVKQIPAAVQKALGLPAADPLKGMTDPGMRFEVGDAVGSERLPFQRLVFGAVNARYCLVYYELGGIAYRHEVALYHLLNGQAINVWRADLTQEKMPVTLTQLRTAIRQGKYQSFAASS